jgi:hypothetical protein
MSSQQPFPHQPHGRDGGPSRRARGAKIALGVLGLVVAMAALVGVGYGFLYAVNPMGDEWVCSDGETPAGKVGRSGEAKHYNHCFEDGSTLPRGYEWDPFGNRPMPSNCDKDGWVQIERPVPGHRGATEEDCVRTGTELPEPWRVVEGD